MRRFVTRLVVVAAFAAAACGDSGGEGADAGAAAGDAGGSSGGDVDASVKTDAGGGSDAGSAGGDAGSSTDKHATVMLEAKSTSTTTGMAVFARGADGKVSVTLTVMGAPDGKHGVHIHATGDCSAPDATSAGGHWNPDMHVHGDLTDPSTTHLGDLGNITITGGMGTLTKENSAWTIGDSAMTDVIGKALIVHADPDDLTTQANADAGITPGNSGKRISCGVIKLAN